MHITPGSKLFNTLKSPVSLINQTSLSFIVILLLIAATFYSCSKNTAKTSPSLPSKASAHLSADSNTTASTVEVPKVNIPERFDQKIEYLKKNSPWVDSVFNSLSPEERIGQLIMFDAYSNMKPSHLDTLLSLVKDSKVGGLVFFQGGPGRQINMINKLQAAAKVPLLIAMDAETGIGMRLDSTNRYPYQMTLGAITDNKLIYEMGKAIANDIKRIGMQVNFAPVLDINSNPSNPVIGMRSFGENKSAVTEKSFAYMKGLQDNGVMAVAKHFPGHGDTNVDSHHDLPVIKANRTRLDTLELFPFKQLINEGLGGVMIAHMNIPALDSTSKLPSTLSKPIVTDLLKNELGFKGIIFTDAMVMEGVAKYYPSGTAEPLAVIAGNDILEKMKNARVAVNSIKKAVENGAITQAEIDEKCKKILAAKELLGLKNYKPVETENLYSDLKNKKTDSLMIKLLEGSATLLKNEGSVLPFSSSNNLKIATVSINAAATTPFQKYLNDNINAESFHLPLRSTNKSISTLKKELENYDYVIIGIHDSRGLPGFKLNYSSTLINFINEICNSNKTIITLFGNPYSLNSLSSYGNAHGLLVMYENNWFSQKVASEILLGKAKAKGKLPVSINRNFPIGAGLNQ